VKTTIQIGCRHIGIKRQKLFLWIELNSKSNCKNCQLRVLGRNKIIYLPNNSSFFPPFFPSHFTSEIEINLIVFPKKEVVRFMESIQYTYTPVFLLFILKTVVKKLDKKVVSQQGGAMLCNKWLESSQV